MGLYINPFLVQKHVKTNRYKAVEINLMHASTFFFT